MNDWNFIGVVYGAITNMFSMKDMGVPMLFDGMEFDIEYFFSVFISYRDVVFLFNVRFILARCNDDIGIFVYVDACD